MVRLEDAETGEIITVDTSRSNFRQEYARIRKKNQEEFAKDYGEEVSTILNLRPIPITPPPCRNFSACGKFEETDELEQSVSTPRRGFLAGSCDPEGSANPRIQTVYPNNQRKRLGHWYLGLASIRGAFDMVLLTQKIGITGRTGCPSSRRPLSGGT